ncbi:hypothetical protein FAES_4251 [Fibrella aestuarina BUZ 2]|uniref:Uncharacterized protein n=1 Tax=Fibrella aestuarina BUZ 2 TaxID=1166018 RepID=I0KDP8_9BACT|nr:hypothetical protein [Fibrella aestuarina]CCH02251.1 hypothetical protein FAES_4251 [Fibrella aestuarina BUZ 2]
MSVSFKHQLGQLLHDTPEYHHLHGSLEFKINQAVVPYMGYFGVSDVCLNIWLAELSKLILAYRQGEDTYTIDECEQGQPAFQFDFQDGVGYLSIVESITEAEGDKDWQRIEFKMADLVAAYNQLKTAFLSDIAHTAPHRVVYWQQILEA